jgi:hypothetical protein
MESLVPGGPFHPSCIFRTKQDWAAHISAHTKETVARQLLLPHPKDQAPLEQGAYARLLIGWLTFEGPLPTSEKTSRQRRQAKDMLKQQRRQLEGKERIDAWPITHTKLPH